MPIVALVSDLIFESKITATARQVGVSVETARTPATASTALRGATGCLIDLTAVENPTAFIEESKRLYPELRIVAFVPHVQAELARAARAAGADQVLSRSKFTESLGEILGALCPGKREA